MLGIATLFRSCPACGKRFETRLVGKELVHESKEVERNRSVLPTLDERPRYKGLFYIRNEPNVITFTVREEFRCLYRCKACGHQWSEKRASEHKIS